MGCHGWQPAGQLVFRGDLRGASLRECQGHGSMLGGLWWEQSACSPCRRHGRELAASFPS